MNRIFSRNNAASSTSSVYVSNQPQIKQGKCLMLVDPQYDFVHGSLKVEGADKDCIRVADFIDKNGREFDEIYVTLDTHMQYHIAHPGFWKAVGDTGSGVKHPKIFAQIKASDVGKKWTPVDPSMLAWVKKYTKTLEKNRLPGLSAFVLTIWPPHCLIGTQGHNVEKNIAVALARWERENSKTVHYIIKGNNSKTEHYSAFRAEVIVEEDPNTKFNKNLFAELNSHSQIFVAGQAKSHCVNFTVRDLVDKMTDKVAKAKIVLLEGGMSSVGIAKPQGGEFWYHMTGEKDNEYDAKNVFSNSIAPKRLRVLKLKEDNTDALKKFEKK